MASPSASRPAAGSARMATAAATLSSDYHSLIVEIRKTLGTIKGVAVNLERDKKFDKVQELDGAALELLNASDECSYLSSAIQSVAERYQLGAQNVHHAGQPMPGEEQEEIVMTSTQSILLNVTCPLTGKPVIQLKDPVRCMDCKHIYEKAPILQYITTKFPQPLCPVAGCPRTLRADRVVCDPLLPIEIEEMRSKGSDMVHSTVVEDFTELDDY